MKPGVMVAPAASIWRVEAAARFLMSAFEPTAMKRPSLIAKASARGRDGSIVSTRALTTIRSATTPAPAPAAGCASLRAATARAERSIATPARAALRPRKVFREISAMRRL
jgi:hypothetical protein